MVFLFCRRTDNLRCSNRRRTVLKVFRHMVFQNKRRTEFKANNFEC